MISAYLTRYAHAMMSLVTLTTPAGSRIAWSTGVDIAANINQGIANMIGEWVWIMGDDHNYAPDTLLRLLAHDVDVVTPLCLNRGAPYWPLVFRRELDDGAFEPWPQAEMPLGGLHEVAAGSGAGILIRKHVLDALEPPYFEAGKIRQDQLGEDLYFFHKVRDKGFKVYVDFDTAIGHITPTALWPVRLTSGRWDIVVDPSCNLPATGEVETR
jgi:hypothetical protein